MFCLPQRLGAALVATALAQTAQISILLLDGVAISSAVFTSHLWIILAFQTTVALLAADRLDHRLWAAVVFLIPLMVAVRPLTEPVARRATDLLLLTMTTLFVSAWCHRKTPRGAPLAAAAAGATTAALIAGRTTDGETMLLSNVMIVLVGAGLAIGAGRLRFFAAIPSMSSCLQILVLCCLVLAGTWGFFSPADPLQRGPRAAIHPSLRGAPPIVLIVLDTVRADHLELYGYHRATMPHLARFASQHAVLVERAIANGPSSLPTHASIFTGLYPPRHGAHKPFLDDPHPPAYAYPLDPEIPTLAELLADVGYWTVGISANFGPLSPAYGLARGFAVYDAVQAPVRAVRIRSPWARAAGNQQLRPLIAWLENMEPFASSEILLGVPYRRASAITEAGCRTLEAATEQPFFLFLNYFDAHTPYLPPRSMRHRFSNQDTSLRSGNIHVDLRRTVLADEKDLPATEKDQLIDKYDTELNYLDGELSRLFGCLATHPRWQETLVIITSDHGEALGERRHLGHSISLHDEIVRVPLIIKPGAATPGPLAPGKTLRGPVQSVDLFASVLAHAGLPAAEGIDGLPWGGGRTRAFSWLYPHRDLLAYPRFRRQLRSSEEDGSKLILSSQNSAELYDLRSDPDEMRNLAATASSEVAALSASLAELGIVALQPRGTPRELSDEVRQALQALGYLP